MILFRRYQDPVLLDVPRHDVEADVGELIGGDDLGWPLDDMRRAISDDAGRADVESDGSSRTSVAATRLAGRLAFSRPDARVLGWSGLGIDNAMVHATFLAEAVVAYLSGTATEPDALQAYHRRRDADALAGYRRTVAMSRDLRQLAA